MTRTCVAMTHRTLSEAAELNLQAARRVAIGTAIKGSSASDLATKAAKEVEILERLGREGGLAVVTYSKGDLRLLCRFAAGTPVEPFDGLRSLLIAEMLELPQRLRHIGAERNNTIRELSSDEGGELVAEASRQGWTQCDGREGQEVR